MPIDVGIYQQPPSQGFNTPFQTLAQIGAIQRQRQEIASEKALEQERQQKLADQQRSVQSDQVLSQLFQQHTKINPDTGVTETDHQAVYNGLMGVDPKKAEAYLTVADAAQQRFNAFQLQHQQLAKGALDLQNGLAQIVKDAPPDKRADVWAINRVALGTVNPGVLDHIPQQYPGDDELDKMMNKGQSLSEQIANKFKASETAKNLAEAKKAEGEAGKAPKRTEQEQALDAYAKSIGKADASALTDADRVQYEKRQTAIKSDPIAARAAAATEQANAREVDRQTFAKQQAGRKELTDKVEQPYNDAREKADTLRTVIAAARGGNMQAGAVQSLLGTLGLVTTEGVKRINPTELAATANAGSLLERIKGQASSLTSGQKLSPKLQSDLEELAGLLEKSARKKYESAHKSVTTRYGLTDEQMLPDPNAPAGGGLPEVGGAFRGGKVLKIEKVSD